MNEDLNHKLSQALNHGEDCPALDQLIDLVSGANGEQRRLQAEAHVASCAHCTTELALFRQFEDPAIRTEEAADVAAIVARLRRDSPVPKASSWWKSIGGMRWMAPASVALAALLVGLFVWTPGRTPTGSAPLVSGVDDGMRSARVEIMGPVGEIRQTPASLDWVAVAGAVRYRVTLSEVDHTQVWTGMVNGPSNAALPPSVMAKIVPHKTLTWQVAALDRNGAVIADSGIQRFQLVVPDQKQ